jgi:superfamily II DNA/RNA helicase
MPNRLLNELPQEKKSSPAVMDEIKKSCGASKVVAIQGGPDVSPVFRQDCFDLFATEQKQIMVASDVLARGVDIPSV